MKIKIGWELSEQSEDIIPYEQWMKQKNENLKVLEGLLYEFIDSEPELEIVPSTGALPWVTVYLDSNKISVLEKILPEKFIIVREVK